MLSRSDYEYCLHLELIGLSICVNPVFWLFTSHFYQLEEE